MRFLFHKSALVFLSFIICFNLSGQTKFSQLLLPSDTLNKKRLYSVSIGAAAIYSAASIGLYNSWYKQYDQGPFHFFNDWNEWNDMDKLGHSFSAYGEGVWTYKAARWMGIKKNKAILTGVLAGTLLQSSIEIMDGFSEKWGYSIPDMGFNLLGSSVFAIQQYYWDEQRIRLKVSSWKKKYSNELIYPIAGKGSSSLEKRANNLFGESFAERYLKDYNALTIWASINISSFLPEDSRFPPWLNLAVGYGAENMYGGFENKWEEGINKYQLNPDIFPRYQQFYLGLDVEWSKIFKRDPLIRTLNEILNLIKMPSPVIELNTLGEVHFKLIYI